MTSRSNELLCVIACLLAVVASTARASDHLDVISVDFDLTDFYAFKSPQNPDKVVLVLDTRREATEDTRFPSGHTFSFEFSAAEVAGTGESAAFDLSGRVKKIDCQFYKPDAGANHTQTGFCNAPNGSVVEFTVNDERGTTGSNMRVFAGSRSDPFFMAATEILKDFLKDSTQFANPGKNNTENQNVMSIVVEADRSLFGDSDLIALRTQVHKECSFWSQLWCDPRRDSAGRPEIANMTLLIPFFDAGQRLSIKLASSFNKQTSFAKNRKDKEKYISRFNANLQRWDMMDNKVDWPISAGDHPLSNILYHDYLVMDMRKPFGPNNYLEIEKSMLAGRPHETSGGRWLGEDIVDNLLTYYINRDDGKELFSDFVDCATQLPTQTFPYLAARNPKSKDAKLSAGKTPCPENAQ